MKENRRRLRCTQIGQDGTDLLRNLSVFSIFRIEISLVIYYSGRPRKSSWSQLLQQATHAIHAAFPPGNTCVLFTLRTRCIFCYFRSQCPTSAAALTCQISDSTSFFVYANPYLLTPQRRKEGVNKEICRLVSRFAENPSLPRPPRMGDIIRPFPTTFWIADHW